MDVPQQPKSVQDSVADAQPTAVRAAKKQKQMAATVQRTAFRASPEERELAAQEKKEFEKAQQRHKDVAKRLAEVGAHVHVHRTLYTGKQPT